MPRADEFAAGYMRVPALYAALRARTREQQARWEVFAAQNPEYQGEGGRLRQDASRPRLLAAFTAGRPAVLQGRQLKGHGIPRVPLRRDQMFDWFAVAADDSVVPAESPEDDPEDF